VVFGLPGTSVRYGGILLRRRRKEKEEGEGKGDTDGQDIGYEGLDYLCLYAYVRPWTMAIPRYLCLGIYA